MAENQTIRLHGRVFIQGTILAKTGLHIGGSEAGIAIGGVDNPVIADALTGQPYIPGSSLKGKMRSLLEKSDARPQNRRIGRDVYIHNCDKADDYHVCDVCQVYGVPGESGFSSPTRLVVRDVALTSDSADRLEKAKTDLPFTEVKWEVAIDRVTSAATPRQMERVPAGAEFGPFELVYSLYDPADVRRFSRVVDSMSLLEDDYLGGSGSRGSGKIAFTGMTVTVKRGGEAYRQPVWTEKAADLAELTHLLDKLKVKLDEITTG